MSSPRDTGAAADELRQAVPDIETLARGLADADYLVDESLATSMFLGVRLLQPLLLEGEAGVGKTEAAKALAVVLDTPLMRLQCYEGIDAAEALYEWNYPRQLLRIRLADSTGSPLSEDDLFGPDYLIRRPLLSALEHPGPRPAVLLIDEIDRADDDFEAFLLELLGGAAVANAVSHMRDSDVQKPPGIAEAIDWLAALDLLGVETLDAATVDRTLGSVLKYEDDQDAIRAEGLEHLVGSGD